MTHIIMNTIVLGLCFIYLYTNNKLDKEADEALGNQSETGSLNG